MNPGFTHHLRAALRAEFSGWRGRLLKVLLAVILVCAAILLIYRFFVSGPAAEDAPSMNDIASRLGLQHVDAQSQAPTLLALLGRFKAIAGAPQSVQTVLWREDAAHRLWVFEFKASEVVMVSSNALRPLQRHRAGVTRLGIAVELKNASLPGWNVRQGTDWPPPWTAEAIARAERIEDLWLATDGPFVVALARPDRFPLHEMVGRNISPEFHPGLLNSALAIDVQRVVDVVNLLDTGAPPLPRVYRIDGVEVKLPAVPRPDFSGAFPRREAEPGQAPLSLQELRAESAAKLAEALAKSEVARRQIADDTAAAQAALRSDSERLRPEREQRSTDADAAGRTRDGAPPDSRPQAAPPRPHPVKEDTE